jgi:hypothetical protein
MTMAPALRREDVKVIGQGIDVPVEGTRVGQAPVHQHERIALTVLVVPGEHTTDFRVVRHAAALPGDRSSPEAFCYLV